MIFKLQLFFALLLLSSRVFSQPVEPSSEYKYVLRIQRSIESEIGFYLDEPKTGDLKKVHLESTKYLMLSERDPKHKALSLRSKKLRDSIGQMIEKSYDPNIVVAKNRNTRYHYFYLDEFSKD